MRINFLAWQKTIFHLEDGISIMKLSKNSDITWSYIALVLDELEKRDLIRTKTSGSERKIFLLPKGIKVKEMLLSVRNEMIEE